MRHYEGRRLIEGLELQSRLRNLCITASNLRSYRDHDTADLKADWQRMLRNFPRSHVGIAETADGDGRTEIRDADTGMGQRLQPDLAA